MTSMYDVLKASKGLPVDDIFAELWGRKLSSDYTIVTYTGTLPAVLTGTKAGYLHSYKIYGNTEQVSETPTPENPIVPSECGEKTENLINVQPFTIESDGRSHYVPLWSGTLPVGTYVISLNQYNDLVSALRNTLRITIGGTTYYESLTSDYHLQSGQHKMAFTISDSSQSVEIQYWGNQLGNDCSYSNIMLNTGTTALPYEPYGYKLPLLSGSTPVDIYIGDTPLRKIGDYADYIDYGTGKIVRQVGKIELTGNENYNKNSGSATNYLYYTPRSTLTDSISKTSVVCDRLRAVGSPPSAQIGINTINNYNMVYFNLGADIMNAQPSGNTIDGFKEYLAAQHTAGTPLTIWYVLATPAEEDPPVPFPQIPTTAGSTTISWAGSGLAPSEVEFEYERRR